ncbi:hypothetical protein CCACVL1_15983, partial [Corchorus capsularis]
MGRSPKTFVLGYVNRRLVNSNC